MPMNYRRLSSGRSNRLTLFFLGWGFDANAMGRMWLPDNTLALWDYADMTLPPEVFDPQWEALDIIAWSMGVWAVEECMRLNPNLPWGRRCAIGGTPLPCDNYFGIGRRLCLATATTWNEENRHKFNLRMCDSKEALEKAKPLLGQRTVASQKDELLKIVEMSANASQHPRMMWDAAFIGLQDNIFPVAGQRDYWLKWAYSIIMVEMPHWPFDHIQTIVH